MPSSGPDNATAVLLTSIGELGSGSGNHLRLCASQIQPGTPGRDGGVPVARARAADHHDRRAAGREHRTGSMLCLVDTIPALGMPRMASALSIFLRRPTFKQLSNALQEAARVGGCGTIAILPRV
jgi:hypothetical protein